MRFKNYSFLLFLIIFAFRTQVGIFSQSSQPLLWHTFYGGHDTEINHADRAEAIEWYDNHLYVAGYMDGPGNFGTTTVKRPYGGQWDGFIFKMTEEGEPVWVTFLGGNYPGTSGTESCHDIEIAGDYIYVCGHSSPWNWRYPTTPLHSHWSGGGPDGFVAKLTLDGEFVWLTFLGGQYVDHAKELSVDPVNGYIYVTGNSDFPWPVDDYQVTPIVPHSNDYREDVFAAKLDLDGNLIWNTFMGSKYEDGVSTAATIDYGNGIDFDGSGNIYVGGSSVQPWGTPLSGFEYTSGWDGFIVKLDPDGNRVWQMFIGTTSTLVADDGCHDLLVDNAGNITATGHTWGDWDPAYWGTPVVPYGWNEDHDIFVTKINTSGVPQWYTVLGHGGQDAGEDVILNDNGDVFLTGYNAATWGDPVLPKPVSNSGRDLFAARLDTDGNLLWNLFLGGYTSESGNGITLDDADKVYVGGYAQSSWICIDPPLHPHVGYGDYYLKTEIAVAKLDPQASAIQPEIRSFSFEQGNGRILTTTITVMDRCNKLTKLYTSMGELVDNGDGTWTWNFNSDNLDIGSYKVAVNGDDNAGWTPYAEIELEVLPPNHPPDIEILYPYVEVTVGETAENLVTVSDPDGDEIAMVGSWPGIMMDNGDGTWTWSFNTEGLEPQNWRVTIASDDDKGLGQMNYFDLKITRPPTESEITERIGSAIDWLVPEQKPDGSWSGPYPVLIIEDTVASTAFALTKLCEYAYENGYSPFAESYPYATSISDGFDYLFSQAKTHGEGTGIYIHENLVNPYKEDYNTAAAMLAIAASKTPSKIIVSDNSLVNGLTYMELMDQMVVYFDWAQAKGEGPMHGSWGNTVFSGYIAFALLNAEAMGCIIPQVIKERLSSWIDYIQLDNGGAAYDDPNGWDNPVMRMTNTAHLLIQMALVGNRPGVERVDNAISYIEYIMENPEEDPQWKEQNIELLYTLMKAFELMGIETLTVNGEVMNWYDNISAQLLFFSIQNETKDYWIFSWGADRLLNTCWALLTLERSVPEFANSPPVLTIDNDQIEVDEGTTAVNTGTVYDLDGDPVTLTSSIGNIINNGDGSWDWEYNTTDGPYSTTVVLTATDGYGGLVTQSFNLMIYNLPPVIESIVFPADPVSIDQSININAIFSDAAFIADQPFTASINFGDGTGEHSCNISGNQVESPQYTYALPGVYNITVAVNDKDGGAVSESSTQYLVVYDPSEGFVTGGGWIESPYGAYIPDPDITGKANFGFVSKYKKGQIYPDGNTEFQFRTADLNLHSSSYEWMIITGPKALLKGEGTINGFGYYGFQLSAIDADLTPVTEVDRFRMKIWDKYNNDALVYDNMVEVEDPNADPTTDITGGSIKIHKTDPKKDGYTETGNYELNTFNYPNPFSEMTTILFTIPEDTHVTIRVFDMYGRELNILVKKVLPKGMHQVEFHSGNLDSGNYIYHIETSGSTLVRKMVIIE